VLDGPLKIGHILAIETDHLHTSVASAAVQTFALAGTLLRDAADTLPAKGTASELRRDVAEALTRCASVDDSVAGLIGIVMASREIAQLCDSVAARNRRSSPVALACARLAMSSADLALEAVTEAQPWTGGAALSRRARQLFEIQQLRDQTQRIASSFERHASELSAVA
jgi:hypothetical protein